MMTTMAPVRTQTILGVKVRRKMSLTSSLTRSRSSLSRSRSRSSQFSKRGGRRTETNREVAFTWGKFQFKQQIEMRETGNTFIWRCYCPFHSDPIDKSSTKCAKGLTFDGTKAGQDKAILRLKSWPLYGRAKLHRATPCENSHVWVPWAQVPMLDDETCQQHMCQGLKDLHIHGRPWITAGGLPLVPKAAPKPKPVAKAKSVASRSSSSSNSSSSSSSSSDSSSD